MAPKDNHAVGGVGPDPTGLPAERDSRTRSVNAVLQSMRIVFRAIQAHSRWVEKQCGVSSAQLWALWELFAEPGMPVTQLSQMLSLHQSTTSNMLDKLENKKLVRRERGGPDQRRVRLFLTEEGVSLLATAPRPAQGALTEALQRMPDESLALLEASLKTLVATLRVRDERAALEPLTEG